MQLPKINKHMSALRLELTKEIIRVRSELRPVSAIVVNDHALKDVVKNLVGDMGFPDLDKDVEKAKLYINYNQKQSFQVVSDY